jgi:hypothetical protein
VQEFAAKIKTATNIKYLAIIMCQGFKIYPRFDLTEQEKLGCEPNVYLQQDTYRDLCHLLCIKMV